MDPARRWRPATTGTQSRGASAAPGGCPVSARRACPPRGPWSASPLSCLSRSYQRRGSAGGRAGAARQKPRAWGLLDEAGMTGHYAREDHRFRVREITGRQRDIFGTLDVEWQLQLPMALLIALPILYTMQIQVNF